MLPNELAFSETRAINVSPSGFPAERSCASGNRERLVCIIDAVSALDQDLARQY
jgi:hypothetical protein